MRPRAFILVPLFAGLGGAAVPSAQVTTKFQAERQRLQMTERAKTEAEILHNQLLSPFAAPGVRVQKVVPGSSVSVTVAGDFPKGRPSCPNVTGSRSPTPRCLRRATRRG